LIIKRDPQTGRTYVPDLTRIRVEGPHQIDAIMAHANKHRAVASTKMNERSSRSHSVFTLYLRGVNNEMKTELFGTLNLCDLAGSERLSRSEATGARLKETQHINKSLSALSDVYSALATKSSHVPYRNSKLTYLLQNCFCGDGKTLMFVNLSPTTDSFNER
jgi:kinesin family protein C1